MNSENTLNATANFLQIEWNKNGRNFLKIVDSNLNSFKRIIKEIKKHRKEANIESEINDFNKAATENPNLSINIKIKHELCFFKYTMEFYNILIPKEYPFVPCNIEEINLKIKKNEKYIKIFYNIQDLFEYFKEEISSVDCFCVNYIDIWSPAITLRTFFLQYVTDLNILFFKKKENIVNNILYNNTNKEIIQVTHIIMEYVGDDLDKLL
jgi:hypothetical protein